MNSYGSRAQRLPAPPHVVWESLVHPYADGARPWLELLPDEVAPVVVEAARPELVVWSSLWPRRPDDLVRLELAELPTRETWLHFTLLTPHALPGEGEIGYIRYRVNWLLFGDLRLSYGQ